MQMENKKVNTRAKALECKPYMEKNDEIGGETVYFRSSCLMACLLCAFLQKSERDKTKEVVTPRGSSPKVF
jgi:hypothetical protein